MAQGFTEINNASDEGLVAKIIDRKPCLALPASSLSVSHVFIAICIHCESPAAIGCTPFQLNSLDDPGAKGGSLASGELMAAAHQVRSWFRRQMSLYCPNMANFL